MDTAIILNYLNKTKKSFKIYERRKGKYQLIAPILHEDGDMVDIYLQKSPKGARYIRICDFGMAVQRLSYSYEINTPLRKKIFNSILMNNGLQEDNGNLYLDTPVDKTYEAVLQFAGCVQKVCSMDYWSREIAQPTFYKDLQSFILKELAEFKPESNKTPLSGYEEIEVDWSLKCNNRQFYLFGVLGNKKANHSAIALLELKKVSSPFTSLIVHQDIESLGNKELKYLTKNADKQYPILDDFSQEGVKDIKRLAA